MNWSIISLIASCLFLNFAFSKHSFDYERDQFFVEKYDFKDLPQFFHSLPHLKQPTKDEIDKGMKEPQGKYFGDKVTKKKKKN